MYPAKNISLYLLLYVSVGCNLIQAAAWTPSASTVSYYAGKVNPLTWSAATQRRLGAGLAIGLGGYALYNYYRSMQPSAAATPSQSPASVPPLHELSAESLKKSILDTLAIFNDHNEYLSEHESILPEEKLGILDAMGTNINTLNQIGQAPNAASLKNYQDTIRNSEGRFLDQIHTLLANPATLTEQNRNQLLEIISRTNIAFLSDAKNNLTKQIRFLPPTLQQEIEDAVRHFKEAQHYFEAQVDLRGKLNGLVSMHNASIALSTIAKKKNATEEQQANIHSHKTTMRNAIEEAKKTIGSLLDENTLTQYLQDEQRLFQREVNAYDQDEHPAYITNIRAINNRLSLIRPAQNSPNYPLLNSIVSKITQYLAPHKKIASSSFAANPSEQPTESITELYAQLTRIDTHSPDALGQLRNNFKQFRRSRAFSPEEQSLHNLFDKTLQAYELVSNIMALDPSNFDASNLLGQYSIEFNWLEQDIATISKQFPGFDDQSQQILSTLRSNIHAEIARKKQQIEAVKQEQERQQAREKEEKLAAQLKEREETEEQQKLPREADAQAAARAKQEKDLAEQRAAQEKRRALELEKQAALKEKQQKQEEEQRAQIKEEKEKQKTLSEETERYAKLYNTIKDTIWMPMINSTLHDTQAARASINDFEQQFQNMISSASLTPEYANKLTDAMARAKGLKLAQITEAEKYKSRAESLLELINKKSLPGQQGLDSLINDYSNAYENLVKDIPAYIKDILQPLTQQIEQAIAQKQQELEKGIKQPEQPAPGQPEQTAQTPVIPGTLTTEPQPVGGASSSSIEFTPPELLPHEKKETPVIEETTPAQPTTITQEVSSQKEKEKEEETTESKNAAITFEQLKTELQTLRSIKSLTEIQEQFNAIRSHLPQDDAQEFDQKLTLFTQQRKQLNETIIAMYATHKKEPGETHSIEDIVTHYLESIQDVPQPLQGQLKAAIDNEKIKIFGKIKTKEARKRFVSIVNLTNTPMTLIGSYKNQKEDGREATKYLHNRLTTKDKAHYFTLLDGNILSLENIKYEYKPLLGLPVAYPLIKPGENVPSGPITINIVSGGLFTGYQTTIAPVGTTWSPALQGKSYEQIMTMIQNSPEKILEVPKEATPQKIMEAVQRFKNIASTSPDPISIQQEQFAQRASYYMLAGTPEQRAQLSTEGKQFNNVLRSLPNINERTEDQEAEVYRQPDVIEALYPLQERFGYDDSFIKKYLAKALVLYYLDLARNIGHPFKNGTVIIRNPNGAIYNFLNSLPGIRTQLNDKHFKKFVALWPDQFKHLKTISELDLNLVKEENGKDSILFNKFTVDKGPDYETATSLFIIPKTKDRPEPTKYEQPDISYEFVPSSILQEYNNIIDTVSANIKRGTIPAYREITNELLGYTQKLKSFGTHDGPGISKIYDMTDPKRLQDNPVQAQGTDLLVKYAKTQTARLRENLEKQQISDDPIMRAKRSYMQDYYRIGDEVELTDLEFDPPADMPQQYTQNWYTWHKKYLDQQKQQKEAQQIKAQQKERERERQDTKKREQLLKQLKQQEKRQQKGKKS